MVPPFLLGPPPGKLWGMPTLSFDTMEELLAYEEEQQRRDWRSYHETYPVPAHMVRRQLERRVRLGANLRRGRYGLKAQLQPNPRCPEGWECHLAEDVPFSFAADDGLGIVAPVELNMRLIDQAHPFWLTLYNARRVEDTDPLEPYRLAEEAIQDDRRAHIEEVRREDVEIGYHITGRRTFVSMGRR